MDTGFFCQNPACLPSWEPSQVACNHRDLHPCSRKGAREGQHVTTCPLSHCDCEDGTRRLLCA